VFEATSRKFRDINFKKIDGHNPSNQGLMKKYGIDGYPKVVFLSRNDKMIYSGFVNSDPSSFEELINRFR